MRARAVDLFAGCGGLSLGMREAGIEIVAAFDAWPEAIRIYRENLCGHPALLWDLSDTAETADAILNLCGGCAPDIVAGGPPCQDFSMAGQREEGERANLTRSFAEIVTLLRPHLFVMENVEGARRSNTYRAARAILSEAGYGLNERVLNASLCGVPQARKRFFCIGALGASDGFLDPFIDMALDPKPMAVRQFLESEGETPTFSHYYRHPRTYGRRAVFSVDEPAPTVRGVNRPKPPTYRRHEADAADPAREDIQALDIGMRARIQTFPREFRWSGPRTHIEQMIGNAVPVRLGKFIGCRIGEYVAAVDRTAWRDPEPIVRLAA